MKMLITMSKLRIIRSPNHLHMNAIVSLKKALKVICTQRWKILRRDEVQMRDPSILKRHTAKIQQRIQMIYATPIDGIPANGMNIVHSIQIRQLLRRIRTFLVHMNKAKHTLTEYRNHPLQALIILIGGDDHGLHNRSSLSYIEKGATLRLPLSCLRCSRT